MYRPKKAQIVPKSVFLAQKTVFLAQNQDKTSISPIEHGIIWKEIWQASIWHVKHEI